MKKTLITGATGFIGKALCLRMLRENWQVLGAVRTLSDQERLPLGVKAVPIGSIGPDTLWNSSLERVDIVVHLAARTHVTREMHDDPLKAYRSINVEGTARLAREAAASGVKRFLYLSSVKVNGEGRALPYSELDMPAPEDPYGISKWEAEQVLHSIEKETGMEVVIIRPPLVYGPGVKANFLALLRAINRGLPLPLSRIQNRRSLIYVGNLVDAIVACVTYQSAAGKTYLISDGEDVSTPELIRKISTSLERPVRVAPFPIQLMRLVGKLSGKSSAIDRLIGSLIIDSSKIQQELNWRPPYTMAQGLKETTEWFLNDSVKC